MAEQVSSTGLCHTPCEIDSYQAGVREIGLFAKLADEAQQPIMQKVAGTQQVILDACLVGASTTPCEGRMPDGVKVETWPSQNSIHCPVVMRALGNLNMAQFYSE